MRTVNISKQTHRYNYEFLFLLTNIHIFSREIQIIYILSRCAIKRFIDTDYTGEKNLNHLNALNVTRYFYKACVVPDKNRVYCAYKIYNSISYVMFYISFFIIYQNEIVTNC